MIFKIFHMRRACNYTSVYRPNQILITVLVNLSFKLRYVGRAQGHVGKEDSFGVDVYEMSTMLFDEVTY